MEYYEHKFIDERMCIPANLVWTLKILEPPLELDDSH